MTRSLIGDIIRDIDAIAPLDDRERRHLAEARDWLASTDDVFRRIRRPVAPVRHLVSYLLAVDRESGEVLLGDHIKADLWLPSGGHVEPDEHPADTVRRECVEELGVPAEFLPGVGEKPLFLTITDTVGTDDVHNDVSLWYCIDLTRDTELHVDLGEYRSVEWWSLGDIARESSSLFDPHMSRMLGKLHGLGYFDARSSAE